MTIDPITDPEGLDVELLACEDCGDTVDVRPRPDLWPICAACDARYQEARYAAWLADYYGGQTARTVAEQTEAAARVKVDQRR